ncbi:probable pectinesterase/pectinesterase inhibitor 40 [Raphanus sativus]|uniref:Pectinesterase n=1 Tax=Raphanus sativus TaxID=3726 RepID=A0A9W3C2X3_RAPSA|nr:probable pectinesterase/pectinesterase inhibitor 40 [Raphanus sativus]
MEKTVISSNQSRLEFPKSTTEATATFSVLADSFIARDIKFVNTAGPEKFQAIAFHSKSNQSALFRCAFHGYKDTLYAHAGEKLYRECDIVGTVDFIFGNTAAVFEMCSIRARRPLMQQVVTVTAQGADNQEKSGFSIIRSKILRFEDEEFTAVAYLGRPWKSHATVVVMETELGDLIDPKGWVAWKQGRLKLYTGPLSNGFLFLQTNPPEMQRFNAEQQSHALLGTDQRHHGHSSQRLLEIKPTPALFLDISAKLARHPSLGDQGVQPSLLVSVKTKLSRTAA